MSVDLSSWSIIPDNSVSIFYADPPWHYGHTTPKKDVANLYPVLHLPQLFEMKSDIDRIANKDGCGMFLWTTGPQMWQAMRLLDAWEFHYKTMAFTWVKLTNGGFPVLSLGYYTRSASEFVLFATKNRNPKRKSFSIRQTVTTVEDDTLLRKRLRHSEKPEEIRTRIETLFDGPYFELFARRPTDGWLSWGNELDGQLVDCRKT